MHCALRLRTARCSGKPQAAHRLHQQPAAAALRQSSLSSWSVPGSLCVPGKGRSARATFPKSIYSVLLPSFSSPAFFATVANPLIGARVRFAQLLAVLTRSPLALRLPGYSGLALAPIRGPSPLVARQTRKNWEEKVNGIDRFGAVLNKDGTAPNREACGNQNRPSGRK